MNTSAMGALVMKAFSPEREKSPSGRRRAAVRNAKASLPASGSVSAQQPIRVKPSTGAAQRSRCASFPRRRMTDQPGSPKEARRLERLKQGSRATRDVRPPRSRFGQMTKSQPRRPSPVLGSIGESAGTSDEPTVVLSRRAVERLDQGHVWIYRSDVAAPPRLAGGEVVRLADQRGWFVGKAFYGAQSQIAVRLLTREDEPVDEAFFTRRLAQAKALRDAAAPDPQNHRAGRMVHGEADLLPGLI